MGAIQNAVSGAMTTLAAGAAAAKHISEQQEEKELTSMFNYRESDAEYNEAVQEGKEIVGQEIQLKKDEEKYQEEAKAFEAITGEKNKMSPKTFDLVYGQKEYSKAEKHLIKERNRLDTLSVVIPKRLKEAEARTYRAELRRSNAFDRLSKKQKEQIIEEGRLVVEAKRKSEEGNK